MKSYREELWFETSTRRAYLNITRQVEAVVKMSGVKEGLVLINAMHITAGVCISMMMSKDCYGTMMTFSSVWLPMRRRIATTTRARTTAMAAY